MSKKVFVVGTGRCGTGAIAQAFSGHHEFNIWKPLFGHMNFVQTFFDPKNPKEYVFTNKQYNRMLMDKLFQNIPSSDFLDADNTLSHFIDVLHEKFIDAKFILLIRDGRDYVTSAANRTWHTYECLDHKPLPGDEYYKEWYKLSTIQKNAWSWKYKNERCLEYFKLLPENQKMIFKIEDSKSPEKIKELEEFTGMKCDASVMHSGKINSNEITEKECPECGIKRILPYKDSWGIKMNREFNSIAYDLMKKFNYYEGEKLT